MSSAYRVVDPVLQFRSGFNPCYGKTGNLFDRCLLTERKMWTEVQCRGGISVVCRRVESLDYDAPPWVVQPSQGRRFQEINTVLLPADNTTTVVLSFRVPLGYDGVIKDLVCRCLGLGFVEGSGDLHWRLQLSRRYANDYGDIQTSIGDLTSPVALQGGGIRIQSNQLIQFLVFVAPGAGGHIAPGSRILCALSGWYYPRPA
jgi:hypothetical protein